MNQLKALGLSVAVWAGAGVPAWAAETDAPAATRPADATVPWYKRVFGGAPDKPNAARGVAPTRPAPTAPLTPDVLAEAVEAEKNAWVRRMDVCTELRRVALEKNDEALLRQIDELERQATTLYNQRTAAFGVKRVKAPAALDVLDEKLGTGIAVTPLTAPSSPKPADPSRTARLREVSP